MGLEHKAISIIGLRPFGHRFAPSISEYELIGNPEMIFLKKHVLDRDFYSESRKSIISMFMPLPDEVMVDFREEVERERLELYRRYGIDPNAFLASHSFYSVFDGSTERTARSVQFIHVKTMERKGQSEKIPFDEWRNIHYG